MSPPVCAHCIYLSLGCVCLLLAGVTFGHAVSVVVFLVELNNPFCPQLNGCNGLGMCLQAFLVFLGSGPDCVTGPVTRIDCDAYRRVHSHMMSSLLHAFVVSNSQQNACLPDGIQTRSIFWWHVVSHTCSYIFSWSMLLFLPPFSPIKSQWCSMPTMSTHWRPSSPTAMNTSPPARRHHTFLQRSLIQRQVKHHPFTYQHYN